MRPDPEFMRASEVARRLGVSARTVRRWVELCQLDGVMLGSRIYVPRAAFEELIAQRRRTQKA